MGWTVKGSISGSDSHFYFLQNFNNVSGTKGASYLVETGYVPPELLYETDNSYLSIVKGKNK